MLPKNYFVPKLLLNLLEKLYLYKILPVVALDRIVCTYLVKY